jgi:hypothetical protein
MLAKKTIMIYGNDSAINQIPDNGGVGINVTFLTIEESAFLKVILNNIIEENKHSFLLTNLQKLELLNKLNTSVLYETPTN